MVVDLIAEDGDVFYINFFMGKRTGLELRSMGVSYLFSQEQKMKKIQLLRSVEHLELYWWTVEYTWRCYAINHVNSWGPLLKDMSWLKSIQHILAPPKNLLPVGMGIWGSQSGNVFAALSGDFMKPRINEIDELLKNGVNVTVYNGQVDLICATKGTEAWIEKLKWEGLKTFLSLDGNPLYCEDDTVTTEGFVRSYKNLHFYWILGAGHFVSIHSCTSLQAHAG
ncbi:hypothetical protein MKW98_026088 [Papaver atlanticum]|uniref:Uncharacterized protein n=1 Tax=Papaver atlanticum TaxID=357466 RepID=A0AAD4X5M6_9MAGN|nr:hypothetical protein MKW98_026088 [Papaver atlanticum]